jgi:hypothetical protein
VVEVAEPARAQAFCGPVWCEFANLAADCVPEQVCYRGPVERRAYRWPMCSPATKLVFSVSEHFPAIAVRPLGFRSRRGMRGEGAGMDTADRWWPVTVESPVRLASSELGALLFDLRIRIGV